MALIPKATPMVGSVANVHVPRAEQQVISKEDVEKIRRLLGPKFGSRYASLASSIVDKGTETETAKEKKAATQESPGAMVPSREQRLITQADEVQSKV
ncbi:unnamed protein product [Strongylus vulgaris]|uniref:Uncharacterized protein n=1 Tax=Strongylus vulgaris TaxID=40348 RepID=A0A3P7IF06_STRVU|nr:unnamed protein product [Strongylus vulgaris]